MGREIKKKNEQRIKQILERNREWGDNVDPDHIPEQSMDQAADEDMEFLQDQNQNQDQNQDQNQEPVIGRKERSRSEEPAEDTEEDPEKAEIKAFYHKEMLRIETRKKELEMRFCSAIGTAIARRVR